ncbi:MAG: DUF2332 domain-containing protein [Chloroflexota bacterium]
MPDEEGSDRLPAAARVRDWADVIAGPPSPLYRRLGHAIADDPVLLDRVLATRPEALPGTAVMGFLAAVHLLLLRDPGDPLGAWYPTITGRPVPGADPRGAFRAFCDAHATAIASLASTRTVQTNEIARSSALLPAYHHVARRTGRPLGIVEVGCGAGLNLRFDTIRVDYHIGDRVLVAGDPGSDVVVDCTLTGAVPPLPPDPDRVSRRIGIDLNPLDVRSPEDRAWLTALVFPDQPERHARLVRALERAAADPAVPEIIAGDAVDEVAGAVATVPADAAVVVAHTFVLYQLPEDRQDRFHEELVRLGRSRPVHHLALEWAETPSPTLTLTVHDGGQMDVTVLAATDTFGARLDWRASGS